MTNFSLTHTSRPIHVAAAAGLLNAWRRLAREWRVRRTIETLHALNDRTLRDIGVERGHIADIVRERSPSE